MKDQLDASQRDATLATSPKQRIEGQLAWRGLLQELQESGTLPHKLLATAALMLNVSETALLSQLKHVNPNVERIILVD